ncbi:MAG: peptidoglycan-binding domain-containing protein, partial [Clostridia bacterium]
MKASLHQKAKRALALVCALMMLCATTAVAAAKYSTLEFGARGSDVLKLQKSLLTLGYDPNGTDGKFGRGTETAVMNYQKAKNLTADGKAGNLTLTTLYAELAGSGSSGGSDASGGSGGAGSTNPNTLKYGDSGPRVSELQTALLKLGHDT